MSFFNSLLESCNSEIMLLRGIISFFVLSFTNNIFKASCNVELQNENSNPNFEGKQGKMKMSRENIFKAAFLETRLQHKDAIKSVLRFENYEKQYKITNKALEKIFEVVQASKVIVENSNYIPGSDLPTNETVATALEQIVDNTAMFGDFQLKLPDITDRIMKKHPEYLVLIKWAIGFSNSTGIFDPKTTEMIDLLCQEMNLIARNENFINPYRKYDEQSLKPINSFHPKPKKVTVKKGPRMSKQRHMEL